MYLSEGFDIQSKLTDFLNKEKIRKENIVAILCTDLMLNPFRLVYWKD